MIPHWQHGLGVPDKLFDKTQWLSDQDAFLESAEVPEFLIYSTYFFLIKVKI